MRLRLRGCMQVTFFLPLTNNTIRAPCHNPQTKIYFNFQAARKDNQDNLKYRCGRGRPGFACPSICPKKCNFEANLATGRTLLGAPLLALVFDILRETVELYSVKGPKKLDVLESVCYLVLVSSRECFDALAILSPSGVTWGESPAHAP